MNLIAARAYAQVVRFSKHRFAYAPRGLGRLLRSYRQPHVLSVEGCSVFFYPPIALAYNHAIYGSWPEQETHRFLKNLINELPASTTFVNVAANIGEFVLDLSVNCPRVSSVLAIEPHPDCALVLKVNVALNRLTNVRIEEVVLGESSREVFFHLAEAPQLSSSSAESLDLEGRRYNSIRYQMTTLDALDIASSTNLVLLIDVEGSELDVLKGASKTIKDKAPSHCL